MTTWWSHRSSIISFAIDQLVGHEYNTLPRIGLALSGGSYRALICSLAVVTALRDMGWWEALAYVSSLSGSCWFLAELLVQDVALDELKSRLKEKLSREIFSNIQDLYDGLTIINSKKTAGQPSSIIVDLWGGCLNNILFGNIPNNSKLTLSALEHTVATGKYPFPIFTAVARFPNEYKWLEFTPTTLRSIDDDLSIPIEYSNSRWSQGQLVEVLPEPSLGNLMGIFGSAFAINFNDILKHFTSRFLVNTLKPLLSNLNLSDKSLAEGQLYNPFGPGVLSVVDAGIDFNYPILPLLDRKLDIIILCNFASGDPLSNLMPMFEHLASKNYILPNIDIKATDWSKPQIFTSNLPFIVYIPNTLHFSTFKLEYSEKDFDNLFDSMYTTTINLKSVLKSLLISTLEILNTTV